MFTWELTCNLTQEHTGVTQTLTMCLIGMLQLMAVDLMAAAAIPRLAPRQPLQMQLANLVTPTHNPVPLATTASWPRGTTISSKECARLKRETRGLEAQANSPTVLTTLA